MRSGYESPTLNRGNCGHIFSPLETLQNVIYSFLNSHFHCVWWRSVEAGERFYGVLSTDRKLSFYCFLKLLVLFCLTFVAKSISLVAETPAPRWLKLGYKYRACGSIAVKGGTIVDLRAQFYKALVSIYSEKWPGLCHKEAVLENIDPSGWLRMLTQLRFYVRLNQVANHFFLYGSTLWIMYLDDVSTVCTAKTVVVLVTQVNHWWLPEITQDIFSVPEIHSIVLLVWASSAVRLLEQ